VCNSYEAREAGNRHDSNVVVNLSFFRGGAVFTKATHGDENQIKNNRKERKK